jgi:hypothetical protein
VDAFCKSGAYARKDLCLTTGDLHGVPGNWNWVSVITNLDGEMPRSDHVR